MRVKLLLGAPCFFTAIPCSDTSSPPDGAARNFFFITQDHTIHHVWIHLFLLPHVPEKRKTIWSELESNLGRLAHKRPL